MKRIPILLMMLMVAASQMLAGGTLELQDVARGKFRSQRMAALRPAQDGESYLQISPDGQRIEQYSFKTGKLVSTLLDLQDTHGAKVRNIENYIVSPDGKRLLIQTESNYIYRRSFTAKYYIYDIQNKKLETLSDGGPQRAPLFSPDGLQVAFVRDNNIFLVKLLYNNAESQITKDGKFNEVINGVPDWVYEEEFSTAQSMAFTPDSKQLCWIRYDESQVKEFCFPLYRGANPANDQYADYPGLYAYKYPIAGEQNSKVSVMSYDIKSHKTRTLSVPLDADGYIPRIKTYPLADAEGQGSSQIIVMTMNRHQDCLRLYAVNALSTLSQLILEETADKYVKEEVLEQLQLTPQHILLPSDRSGFMHLYLYTIGGQLVRQVEQGDYEVSDVYGYDEVTGDTYFASHANGATEQQVFVAHKNGKVECLTPKAGWSSAIFSKNYKYFINTWSDMNTPTTYSLHEGKKQTAVLIDNKALSEKLSQYQIGTRELFTFTTGDGVQLNGWMVKPADFSASKRYPVIMYQYGGPGSQQVRNAWDIGMCGAGAIMEQYLCQQGYICVCVDNRGTGGRGADFEKSVYMKLGELESRDQVEAALWLGRQSYVDKDRIGIWGWSYGGWNTLMSMSEGRNAFAAGVAIAPPTSWRYYDTIYSERYMRTPQENADGYDRVNPIARAGQLHGALLLCHGLADDNVHFRNTAEYTEALVQADKDFRQVTYTNRNHSIYGGNTRLHLYRQAINHFNEKLKD
ncbi:MAG: S9 family peptidase [Prevotella sp.]|nr:S9 family peptidase [Prevotella sp.]